MSRNRLTKPSNPIEHTMNIRSFRSKGRRAEDESGVGCLRPAQDLADKLARDCRSIMMSLWYRQIFRTRLAAHRNAVQEFITTTSLSCSAGSQKPPSSAANRNPLRPCTPRLDGMVRREEQSWLNHCAAPPLLSTAGNPGGR